MVLELVLGKCRLFHHLEKDTSWPLCRVLFLLSLAICQAQGSPGVQMTFKRCLSKSVQRRSNRFHRFRLRLIKLVQPTRASRIYLISRPGVKITVHKCPKRLTLESLMKQLDLTRYLLFFEILQIMSRKLWFRLYMQNDSDPTQAEH